MAVALVVMIVAFGAIVAAFVPIITAIVGLSAATSLIFLGTSFLSIPSFTTFLASMIGIALSIDYALFIVSRYKHELAIQDSGEEAAGTALGTAGSAWCSPGDRHHRARRPAIVGVRFLTFMGLGGAIAAGFAVLTAITLMPRYSGRSAGSFHSEAARHSPSTIPRTTVRHQRYARRQADRQGARRGADPECDRARSARRARRRIESRPAR